MRSKQRMVGTVLIVAFLLCLAGGRKGFAFENFSAIPLTPTVPGGVAPAVIEIRRQGVPLFPLFVGIYSTNPAAIPLPRGGIHVMIPPGVNVYPFALPTLAVAQDKAIRVSIREEQTPEIYAVETIVTVLAPIAGLGFSEVSAGGNAVTGIIALSSPAPQGGVKVSLVSANPSIVSVPSAVLVPPGQTLVEFPVSTTPVASSTSVNIRVDYAGHVNYLTKALVLYAPRPVKLDVPTWFQGGPQTDPPSPPPPSGQLGGFPAQAVVTLDGPAPTGGLTVPLMTSDPQVAGVPQAVIVPPGAMKATFMVTTNAVSSNKSVSIAAHEGGQPLASDTVTVLSPVVLSVEIAGDPIVGGGQTTGTVYLSGTAPPGGTTLLLHNGAPTLVTFPATVNVLSGQMKASFPVSTSRVLTTKVVAFSASLGGQVTSSSMTLLPARLGDANGDGDIDADDFRVMRPCFGGPTSTPSEACRLMFGFDGRYAGIDLRDVAAFSRAFTASVMPGQVPKPTVTVDPTIQPVLPELLPLAGATPRPLAALTDRSGIPASFVENELMVVADNVNALNAFVARWQGVVLRSEPIPDAPQPQTIAALVRINTTLADPRALEQHLAQLQPNVGGDLRVSSEAGRRLLAAAAAERVAGVKVAINPILIPQTIENRDVHEAPSGPGEYTPNPFCWGYMMGGGPLDIGVTEAWRALRLNGIPPNGHLVPNSVRIGVIEGGGFQTSEANPNPEFPTPDVLPDGTVEPRIVPNSVGCSDGSSCLYHGNEVLGALMSVPDDNRGVAGPAGPVGVPVLFVPRHGYSDFLDMVTTVFGILKESNTGRTKIFNISGEVRLPAATAVLVDATEALVAYIVHRDVLIFAAAGNQGTDVNALDCRLDFFGQGWCWERAIWVPCEMDDVICVGGLRHEGSWAGPDPSSNYGGDEDDDTVDIWAPYGVWVGPNPEEPSVHPAAGTSMASPFAAGVAALIWAADPSLTGGQVWATLRDTAHSGEDPKVTRYVDAHVGVLEHLLSDPPSICIASPSDGSPCEVGAATCPDGPVNPYSMAAVPTYSLGYPVYLSARIADREAGSGCSEPQVRWTSNIQPGFSVLGVNTVTHSLIVGTHRLRATVEDCHGLKDFDEVEVNIVNDPPGISIFQPPLDDAEFCVGELINFRAIAWDPNNYPIFTVPDSQIVWSSDREGRTIGGGAEMIAFLTKQGTHTITVRVEDSQGASATDQVRLTVGPACSTFSVQITQPLADTGCGDPGYEIDGYDSARGMWYTDVVLEGKAWDVDDGELPDRQLEWRTDRTDIQTALLGAGKSITVRLYSNNCPGVWHSITLKATDNSGNIRYAVRRICIWQIC